MVDGRQADFEAVFGIGGAWTRILHKAAGYLLTEIWCESPQKWQYRLRDFWDWHVSFEKFRVRFQSEYGNFESWIVSNGLIEKEKFLGAYYLEHDDGDDLVPS